VDGRAFLGISTGGTPDHVVEFGDRVGEEKQAQPPARFEPTAANVSDMDRALRLLEGLRPPFFKVVLFRALDEFARENAEPGEWPWKKIGGYFGMSDRWAEAAYDAAIVQAARRAGILPMVPNDHAILAVAAWVDGAWLTCLANSADPRQEASNLRSKSPVRIETGFAIWTPGKPLAKRVLDYAKPRLRNLLDHGAWYKVHPDTMAEALIAAARETDTPWHMEDLDLRRASDRRAA